MFCKRCFWSFLIIICIRLKACRAFVHLLEGGPNSSPSAPFPDSTDGSMTLSQALGGIDGTINNASKAVEE